MSVAPVVFIRALHAPILPFVSTGPNFPIPNTVGFTPEGGVARTVPAYTAVPRTAARDAHANFDLISPPFRPRLPRRRKGRQARPPRPPVLHFGPTWSRSPASPQAGVSREAAWA